MSTYTYVRTWGIMLMHMCALVMHAYTRAHLYTPMNTQTHTHTHAQADGLRIEMVRMSADIAHLERICDHNVSAEQHPNMRVCMRACMCVCVCAHACSSRTDVLSQHKG